MPSPEMDILPGALDMTYMQRIEGYVTTQQYERLELGLRSEGVIDLLGSSALEKPWSTYMDIMDGIVSAHAAVSSEHPGSATLHAYFTSADQRDLFHDVNELLLGATHGNTTMPKHRPLDGDNRMLRIFNYSYADVSTAGRIGTVLLRKEYLPVMGTRNVRVIQTASLGTLRTENIVGKLPDTLQARIDGFYQRHGDKADNLLLSSGNFGVIGQEMRDVLDTNTQLVIQRPRSNRPAIEKDTKFRARGEVPISTSKLSNKLAGQVQDRFLDFAESYKRRDIFEAVRNIWELGTGLGKSEGAAMIIQALWTITAANAAAIKGSVADRRLRKNVSNPKS